MFSILIQYFFSNRVWHKSILTGVISMRLITLRAYWLYGVNEVTQPVEFHISVIHHHLRHVRFGVLKCFRITQIIPHKNWILSGRVDSSTFLMMIAEAFWKSTQSQYINRRTGYMVDSFDDVFMIFIIIIHPSYSQMSHSNWRTRSNCCCDTWIKTGVKFYICIIWCIWKRSSSASMVRRK